MKKRIICVAVAFMFILAGLLGVFPYRVEAAQTKVNLTDAKKKELNEFFSPFVHTINPLRDYDIDDIVNGNDVLLDFAIFRAYSAGMSWYYSNGNRVNNADFGITDDYKVYMSASSIDAIISKLFAVENIQHRIPQSEFGYALYEYKNNMYYMSTGDGTHWQEPNVLDFYDNGNGTFSAKIEIDDYGMGSHWDENPKSDKYYATAVLQPYNDNGKDTYQLLYWKNNVKRDEPLPIRQSPGGGTIATPSLSKWIVNGVPQRFAAFLINDENYIKLRDIAAALSGTSRQFSIGAYANNRVPLTSGQPYIRIGDELTGGNASEKQYEDSKDKLVLDGKELNVVAYKIDDANYFRLKDLAMTLGFDIEWDDATKSVTITTPTRNPS